MTNEYQPQFETDLAQAAEPTGVDGETVEPINDPARSLEQGLVYLYDKYLGRIENQHESGLFDKAKTEGLIGLVLELVKKDGLENKVRYSPLERAKEIMGAGTFFGRDEVRKAFGIEVKNVPPIPFSRQELERARELDQFLVLRTNVAPDGQPLTMQKINEILQPKFEEEGKGRVLYLRDWFINEEFFTTETPQLGWALTSRKIIPNSDRKDYLDQTEVLADYLVNQIFAGQSLPRKYRDNIDHFNASKDEIRQLIESDWEEAAQRLLELRINQLCRQSAVEALYDIMIYFQNTGERILETEYTWIRNQDTYNYLITIGSSDAEGVGVGGFQTSIPDHCGVLFSRPGTYIQL